MTVLYEDDNIQVVEMSTDNGSITSFVAKPGGPADNLGKLKQRAQQSLATNSAYLAQPEIPKSPTLAQLTAAVQIIRAEVDALARQNNTLIRLNLSELDDISDT